jgi:hypothetical protein
VTPETEHVDTGWEDEPTESAEVPIESIDIPVDEQPFDEGEITTGETEISLQELGLGDGELESGDDPHPSPFERPTIVPPIPEQEYVAQMMRDLPESEQHAASRSLTPRVPQSAINLSVTPATGTKASDIMPPSSRRPTGMAETPISSRPTPVDAMAPVTAPLTLDLSDDLAKTGTTIPPLQPLSETKEIDSGAPEQTGVRERSAFPAAAAVLSFDQSSGDALALVGERVASVKPGASPSVTMREVRDRFDVGDFTGALVLAEGILGHDAENADALLYAEHCRDVLKQMYISRLGGMKKIPQVAMSPEDLRWLALDHRAGFLLSLVDGRCAVDEILDVSGMPDLDALRVLMQLLQQNVIKVL